MASFYRFQGQEQETFPLSKLGIDDAALAQWLDQIQLYHFPWRDYAAGLATFLQTDPIPTEDSLYAAFAANPANFTDETGGMIDPRPIAPRLTWRMKFPATYDPAHRSIPPGLQSLLDRLEANPDTLLTPGQLLELRDLHFTVVWQRTNPINLFLANEEVVFPEKNPDSYFLKKAALAILDREADRMFAALRREQEDWLRRYTPVVSEQWRRQTGEFLFYDAAELARRGVLLDDEKDDQKDDQKDDEYPTDDEVVTDDLNQRMEQLMVNSAPAPQAPSTEAPAAAAREDFTVERSGAQEEEKKAEETNEPPHLPHSQMPD